VPGQLFVSTDARGTQYFGGATIRWSLPVAARDGTVRPGEWVHASAETPLPLLDTDGLLDEGLTERVFRAEPRPGAGSRRTDFGLEVAEARLVSETPWTLSEAARFAIDCADHILGERASMALPSGPSLGDVLSAARRWLERAEGAEAGLLGRVARMATVHRLRKRSSDLSDLAFGLAVVDERRDLDTLNDPDWVAIATTRDAVLASVEALRHQAFPHLVEDENVRYEVDTENEGPPEVVPTPWGNFMAGRRSGAVPAWVAARDAAERARQAAADEGGPDAAAAERAWQVERLEAVLG